MTPEIIALLMLDALFLFFAIIAFVLSVRIFVKWNRHATTPVQYALEKQSYLVSVVIKYIFVLKIPLFLFFIFTCDKLSNIITGAMCAAGVVNSVEFGLYLTLFKIINLYLFGFWLIVNRADMQEEKLPFTKLKFLLFSLFFFPLVAEIGLEISFFASLNISKIVSCCGTLFSAASTSYLALLFSVDSTVIVGIFYFFAALVGVAYFLKNRLVFIFANGMFAIFAIISLIVFFSTYVYELPTHNCPFCLLQKEYYGIGYLMYSTLFIGTFFGMCGGILEELTRRSDVSFFTISIIFDGLYCVIVTLYPVVYYLNNGVWL
ncbi:MAG: hypothetical protein PHR87_06135 [Sulfurospirillaceae bacterium]|nr:hypothetical protein [Sulfurospirillaceae bacterium]